MKKWVSKTDKQLNTLVKAIKTLAKKHQSLAAHVDAYDAYVASAVVRPERAVAALVRSNESEGARAVNPLKTWVKPIILRTTTGQRTVTVSANSRNTVAFVAPQEENLTGDLEVYSLKCVSRTSPAYRVMIKHNGIGRFLMNEPVIGGAVFADMTFGNPQPTELKESIFLESGGELTVEIYDFSGNDNVFEFELEARRFLGFDIDGLSRQSLIDLYNRRLSFPYWLTSDSAVALASNANAFATPVTFTVDGSFHLEIFGFFQQGSIGGVISGFKYRADVKEGASGRTILDDVNVCSLSDGSVTAYPHWFKESWLAKPKTPITAALTNLGGEAGKVADLVWIARALPYPALAHKVGLTRAAAV